MPETPIVAGSNDPPNDRVRVGCLICGSGSDAPVVFVNGYRIARCSNCDFVFVNPRPTNHALSKIYSSQDSMFFHDSWEPSEDEEPILLEVVREIQKHVRTGKLLEVGCARGDFLRIAQSRGFSVTGCDLFGDKMPTLEGATFFNGFVREARFQSDHFDVVVVRGVLEHLFDPNEEINELRRVLKPNGYLYLKVPNVEFEYGLRCQLVFFKSNVFWPPYHLNYFSPKSLKSFLKNSKLEFVSWYLEQPTPSHRWLANAFMQTGYKLIEASYVLTQRRIFPKVVLCALTQKAA